MGTTLDRPNSSRVLIYTGGTVTRAVQATGKMPGLVGPSRLPNSPTQAPAADLNAGTATFAEAAGASGDANGELSVFQGIDPTTRLPWADHLMRPGRYDAVLQGITFLTAVVGDVVIKTFGSSDANAKVIITLSQTATATTQFGVGEYVRIGGATGIFVPGGFYFTTATAVNSFMLNYDIVPVA